jgi:cholesterol transport system auxiliary component
MKTPIFIAKGSCLVRTISVFGLIFMAGCSALPQPPAKATLYDFGPAAVPSAPASQARAPLPPLVLTEVESAGRSDVSANVYYRLAYSDAQQLRPYAQSRWSQPPGRLVEQRLRDRLGEQRAVLSPSELTAARSSAGRTVVLNVVIEEFSQVFSRPAESTGLLRLRATLLEAVPGGESLLGQRVFVVQRAAPSADAAGGVRALAEATDEAAQEIAQWLEAMKL